VAVFTPANYRYFHGQGSSFLGNSDLQRDISPRIQRDVAAHPAASGGEVEQDPFPCSGIALDTCKETDWNSRATSWLHRHNLRYERTSEYRWKQGKLNSWIGRMLKKSISVVLASLRGSTYRSVRLATSLAAALLNGLFEHSAGHYL
jgi:hypothetical protein